jgi:assimilatory nitrate reductase catalytic subunit
LIADGRLIGFRLSGDISAGDWLRETLASSRPPESLRRWLLGPYATPPAGVGTQGRGRIVCNCFDVSESEIAAQIADGADLESLQARLKCGTSCGSCLPELRRALRLAEVTA